MYADETYELFNISGLSIQGCAERYGIYDLTPSEIEGIAYNCKKGVEWVMGDLFEQIIKEAIENEVDIDERKHM